MSTPTPLSAHVGGPTFFIDRDLGRHAFPKGLRQAGLIVVTMAEHYGMPRDQTMLDHEWMVEAARHGWPVLGCDTKHRRRRRPAERAALIHAGVQNFILNDQISAEENVERVLHNLDTILAACGTPGPFVYRVHPQRIELQCLQEVSTFFAPIVDFELAVQCCVVVRQLGVERVFDVVGLAQSVTFIWVDHERYPPPDRCSKFRDLVK